MKTPFMAYSMRGPYATAMMMFNRPIRTALLVAAALTPLTSLSAQRSRSGEQESIYQATQNGTVLPMRQIENGVVPQMKSQGADYIGQEFDPGSKRYRLKFMRGQSVIWVDVDGRTGAIVGRAGG
jgi:hypothetical protein